VCVPFGELLGQIFGIEHGTSMRAGMVMVCAEPWGHPYFLSSTPEVWDTKTQFDGSVKRQPAQRNLEMRRTVWRETVDEPDSRVEPKLNRGPGRLPGHQISPASRLQSKLGYKRKAV
jgi:hypothetical protein